MERVTFFNAFSEIDREAFITLLGKKYQYLVSEMEEALIKINKYDLPTNRWLRFSINCIDGKPDYFVAVIDYIDGNRRFVRTLQCTFGKHCYTVAEYQQENLLGVEGDDFTLVKYKDWLIPTQKKLQQIIQHWIFC